MKKALQTASTVRQLEDIPNVGKAVADMLRRAGIATPDGLRGRDPYELYAELNAAAGIRHDPCLLDTFIAVSRFMAGGPAKPWWDYTAERKARLGQK